MNPDSPPMTNSTTKPAKNRNGVRNTGRPVQIVPSQANTATALGTTIAKLAALKNDSDTDGSTVANMWCTQTPKPSTIVVTVASATAVYPTRGRRQNVGSPSDTMPIAGSTIA